MKNIKNKLVYSCKPLDNGYLITIPGQRILESKIEHKISGDYMLKVNRNYIRKSIERRNVANILLQSLSFIGFNLKKSEQKVVGFSNFKACVI